MDKRRAPVVGRNTGATWDRLSTVISAEPRISTQINRLVGADGMAFVRVDQDSICRFIVQPFRPVLSGEDFTYPGFDNVFFERRGVAPVKPDTQRVKHWPL
jgi:hypothetical protein